MSMEHDYVRVRIRTQILQENFRRIQAQAAHPMPVIKSDAYGHGLPETALALTAAGATSLAAGTVEEAAILKDVVPQAQVLALLGPLDPWDYACACERDIVACVSTEEQLFFFEEAARKSGHQGQVALKFDTGMARLGFCASKASEVASILSRLKHVRPVLVCSHLATADSPEQAGYVREQTESFVRILDDLRQQGVQPPASLANSAAIFGHPATHFDMQRPGIALYGANPFQGTIWEDKAPDLALAMTVSSRLLHIRSIEAGQSVSYGRTFTAQTRMRIGIVAVGYADNYARSLSGKAAMLIRGQRAPVLGRVCMQLTAVDLSALPEADIGDAVCLLGSQGSERISVEELAAWWGTISYEVFCLLGQNRRECED